MSSKNQKKFSLMIANTDTRAHSAYKSLTQTKKENSVGTHYEMFKNIQRQMHFPFGLTEQRFKWQNTEDHSYTGRILEPQYGLVRRQRVKSCLDGGFEMFYDQTNRNTPLKTELNSQRDKSAPRSNRKLAENINSIRVIIPKRDVSIPNAERPCKKIFNTKQLQEELQKTPEKISRKKRFDKSNDAGSVNLFSEEYHKTIEPHHKVKKDFDLKVVTTGNGYAGVRSSVLSTKIKKNIFVSKAWLFSQTKLYAETLSRKLSKKLDNSTNQKSKVNNSSSKQMSVNGTVSTRYQTTSMSASGKGKGGRSASVTISNYDSQSTNSRDYSRYY